MAATPLGSIVSQSWKFFMKRLSVILAAAIVVGIIVTIVQVVSAGNAAPIAQRAINSAGLDMARIQELQQRVQQGDTTALQELQKETEQAAQNMPQNPREAARTFLPSFLHLGAIFVVMGVIVGLLSLALNAFIFLITLEDKSGSATMKRVATVYLPLLGVSIVAGIASLVWLPIPLINLILTIIIGPRLLLAPVLLVSEKKRIIESVKLSWNRSAGYWGKIVGNALVVGIVIMIVEMILAVVLGKLGVLILPTVNMICGAFMVVFGTKLALTILENPKKA